jgi:2'-5' RNA ligase
MPETTRTFVAVEIPAPQGEKLTRLQQQLAPRIPTARMTSSPPFHLTLAFLGDVPDTDLNLVCRAVAEACGLFSSFELWLEGVGAFPSPTRPRVIWAGLVGADGSPLAELHQTIARALKKVGYRPDDKFSPHVTLGRIRQDRRGGRSPDLTAIFQPFQNWSGGTFRVSEIVTFSSTLTPEGPIYAPLGRAPLGGQKNH